ncbi:MULTISPECIES: energy-coupling factor ABC transporter substrate-binding protein [unclassified Tolypothrix]|uniref:energy-coupling factor ABC transporter substrate-binding protein n=1 Tax=unclassified Tolypothrix TaxID=2649714 RepID=UPI0005EAB5B1|nr:MULTISPECIES: energy-coupling factor ABC transporter substrate-binding protein [unclassified Tolypothrix]BAY93598.1 cobalt transport protein CbiN [Microchaete diplosiphon NIES-3275]EKE99611.1 cobalt transport protein [Tolypothrix sp. PCC 7601]MBE9082421.1 energy-coupling factor ABC transporter substrate-binding protein [Tolypothrix sp. LEGE 11397]UYD27424.1 energy-coupling factor ABC transporter substrate-binding protein [Tolypothrix sp. PCC 7712]UYD36711.1 energy-coupling factor ABC transp
MKQSHKGWHNWLLVLAVIGLAIAPLILARDAEFGGSDGEAQKAISQVKPGYEPWFQPLFQPPSKEIESLLFASQAALGAGVIGYAIGLYRGRSQQQRDQE